MIVFLGWSIKIKTLLQSAEWVLRVWPIWSHRLSDNHVGDQCCDFHHPHRDNHHKNIIIIIITAFCWMGPGVWPIWSHCLSDNHVGYHWVDVHRPHQDNQHQDDLQVGRWSLWAIGGHQQWLSARWRSSFLFVSFLSHFFVGRIQKEVNKLVANTNFLVCLFGR